MLSRRSWGWQLSLSCVWIYIKSQPKEKNHIKTFSLFISFHRVQVSRRVFEFTIQHYILYFVVRGEDINFEWMVHQAMADMQSRRRQWAEWKFNENLFSFSLLNIANETILKLKRNHKFYVNSFVIVLCVLLCVPLSDSISDDDGGGILSGV